mmetsp:Transcript_5681/g.11579  ORF Transcript_5681/g.11579 Transcript_5681/m.11579 type:complete len:232 (-) Transcript_5681:762-1457(-)
MRQQEQDLQHRERRDLLQCRERRDLQHQHRERRGGAQSRGEPRRQLLEQLVAAQRRGFGSAAGSRPGLCRGGAACALAASATASSRDVEAGGDVSDRQPGGGARARRGQQQERGGWAAGGRGARPRREPMVAFPWVGQHCWSNWNQSAGPGQGWKDSRLQSRSCEAGGEQAAMALALRGAADGRGQAGQPLGVGSDVSCFASFRAQRGQAVASLSDSTGSGRQDGPGPQRA